MKKGILFRGLGLALAVSITTAQGSFVSFAAKEEVPAQLVFEEDLLGEELTETPEEILVEEDLVEEDSAASASSDAERLLEDDSEAVSEDISEDISDNSSEDISEEIPEDTQENIQDDISENSSAFEVCESDVTTNGGNVANGIKWDLSGGILTVSGKGAIPDYAYAKQNQQPWAGSKSSIKKLVISGSITTIGQKAFENLENLETVEFKCNVITIKYEAFRNTGIKNMELPSSVREIGERAFCDANLKEITLPSGLTNIGNQAFKDNRSLKTVKLNSKQISMAGAEIFMNCSINSVVFPAGIKEIPYRLFHAATFDNCRITIPKTVTKIRELAFGNTLGLSEVNFQEGSVLTTIEGYAFESAKIKTLKLPGTVTFIGNHAFAYTGISEVVIPSKVTTIKSGAFANCSSLRKVDIRSTHLTTAQEDIFNQCALGEVLLPQGLKSIPAKLFQNATFENCDIVIPSSVTTIGDYAFSTEGRYARSISGISFEAGSKLTKIGTLAFYKCNIDVIKLPASLKIIERMAFRESGLTEVVIPSKVTKIGAYAFAQCKYLSKVTLPSSLKTILDGAFNTALGQTIKFYVKSGSYAHKWIKKNTRSMNCVIAIVSDISYVLNGGKNDASNPTVYESGDYIDLKDPKRTGYTFGGWYLDKKLKKSFESFDTKKGKKLTVYAKWTANTYTVKYDLNAKDAALTGNNEFSLKYASKYPKNLSKASRTGYKFAGWYTLPAGGTRVVGAKTRFKSPDPDHARLYAHWTPIRYKITYKLAGGKLTAKRPKTYTTNADLTLPVPTKAGYTFTGWQIVTAAGNTALAKDGRTFAGNKGYYGNVTVKATWKVNGL